MQMSDVTQIVARAAADPAFRSDLAQNPKAVLTRSGINLPAGVDVKVHLSDAKTFHAVLPLQATGEVLEFIRKANPVAAKVYERAWREPAFKQRLFSQPREAFVEATGIQPPAGLTLVPHEDTPQLLNIVVPHISAGGELSDADLEHVAGGKGDVSRCNDAMIGVAAVGAEITIDATFGGAGAGGPIGAGIGFGLGAIGTGLAVGGTALASVLK